MFLAKSNLMKKRTLLIAGIVAIVISISIVTINFQNDLFYFETMDYDGIPKAVIIDQLHKDYPSKSYQKEVTEILSKAGYKVDIVETDEVTLEFYKQLPSMNYKIIIFRGHSLGESNGVTKSASLFTGEVYTHHKYIKEQFLDQVAIGVPYLFSELRETGGVDSQPANKTYFVVGSKMVDELMVGNFDESIIILAGCETMEGKLLADSFLKRGASDVIGWSGLIGVYNNDMVVTYLLNETLANGLDIGEAVDYMNEQVDGQVVFETAIVHQTNGV